MPRPHRRHPDPHHRGQPRARRGRRCICCRRSGFATRGRGAARHEGCEIKPRIELDADGGLEAKHATLGNVPVLRARRPPTGRSPTFLFTENETNFERLFKLPNGSHAPVKDAFHRLRRRRQQGRGQPADRRHQGGRPTIGSTFRPAQEITVRLRLFAEDQAPAEPFGTEFDRLFAQRDRRGRRVLRRASCPKT